MIYQLKGLEVYVIYGSIYRPWCNNCNTVFHKLATSLSTAINKYHKNHNHG